MSDFAVFLSKINISTIIATYLFLSKIYPFYCLYWLNVRLSNAENIIYLLPLLKTMCWTRYLPAMWRGVRISRPPYNRWFCSVFLYISSISSSCIFRPPFFRGAYKVLRIILSNSAVCGIKRLVLGNWPISNIFKKFDIAWW